MPGQRRTGDDLAAVIVLLQRADGTQEGWQVFDVASTEWEWLGAGPRGSVAKLTVEGAFYRMARPGFKIDDRGIGQRTLELEE
jgi:hypothetical protein